MKKPHAILAIAMLLALILYLFTPVFRIVLFGVSGLRAIRWLTEWFIVPPILMLLTGAVALVGNKQLSLGASGFLSLVMILFMFLMPDIAKSGNMAFLISQVTGGSETGAMVNMAITYIINPAWGFIIALVLVLVGTILTAVASPASSAGRGGKQKSSVSSRASSSSNYNKLY